MHVFPTEKTAKEYLPVEVQQELKDKRMIRGDGDKSPKVVLIKDFPNHDEAKSGRPFLGKDGISIRKAMMNVGIPFYTTFAYPFYHGNKKPKINAARDVAGIVQEELNRIDCDRYILFGANTAKILPMFDAPFKKFADLLGKTIEVGGKQFRAVPHTTQIANNPRMYDQFLHDVADLVFPRKEREKDVRSEAYFVHETAESALKMLNAMPRVVACDVETSGLDPYTDKLLMVQFSWSEGTGHAVPWDLLTPDEWAKHLSGHKFIFQNGSFDVKVLANNGVFVPIHEDTMLMHSLIDDAPGTHNMDAMAKRYLDIDKWTEMIDYENIEMEDLNSLGRYGARDTDITLRLANKFRPEVRNLPINSILHRAQNSILRSELKGVRVNRDQAFEMQEEIEGHLHDKREYIADTYGLQNPNSPQQVQKILYGELGLPKQKDKGKITTNENAMNALKDLHPLPAEILEYRHLTKASGMYLKNILEATERDGRYHPEFRLAATETGRLTERLLMLIPRPDDLESPDLGKQYQIRMRELFIPDEGMLMIGADYSGLEVAMAAHLTGDEQLIQDVIDKLDTHSAVAIQAFNLDIPLEPYDTLKKRVSENHGYHRTVAKRATFTWLYGGTEAAIASQVGTDKQTASLVLDTLRRRYPQVAAWQDATKRSAQTEGFVSTPWGRIRRFYFHKGLHKRVIEEQLRESINSGNQGMSSDINIAAFAELEEKGVNMLFPFHDAIYAQAPETHVKRVADQIQRTMEGILDSRVPFRADVKWGSTWAELG